ncbi:MAG: YhbY family RNA-binding protein [Rectinema sp.]
MLDSRTRSLLTGLASTEAVTMHLGKAGAGDALAAQLDTLLDRHELVRLRFTDFKDERRTIAEELAGRTRSEVVRVIGNTALFFRRNPDPALRRIELPGD